MSLKIKLEAMSAMALVGAQIWDNPLPDLVESVLDLEHAYLYMLTPEDFQELLKMLAEQEAK